MAIFPYQNLQDYEEVAYDLIWRLFALRPGEYGVTDESRLADFRGLNGLDERWQIERKVSEEYGVEAGADEPVLTVVERIAARWYP